jgi:hypothetical protein
LTKGYPAIVVALVELVGQALAGITVAEQLVQVGGVR